jgi:CBS domain containing-hemolysin-like protein
MDWNAIILIALKLVAVVFLVFLNGFFVATEFALVKVRQTQLEPFVAKGNRRARMALNLAKHLDAYLSACQLGITLASLGLGWIGEPVFAALLEPVFNWVGVESVQVRHSIAIGVGFTTITFLHIVVGEMAPKSLAIQFPVATSLWVAYPMRLFHVTMYPFIWLLNESSLKLLRMCGIEPAGEGDHAYSEEELRLLITPAGGAAFGRHLALNALDLRQRTVREVMRPRAEVTVLNTEATLAECLEVADKTRFSRLPLCEGGDLDKTRGVVHIKDLYALRNQSGTGVDLLGLARKLIYVPESARLERLLQLFLERKLHLAIVVDEYGGTAGLVTLENILEELVGQIQDEFDSEKPLLVKTGETTWEVSGALPLHDLEELVGEPLRAEGITSTSGWVTHKLGGFPKAGDTLTVGRFDLRVEELDGARVGRLQVTRRVEPSRR